MDILSPKQAELMAMLKQDKLKRINILEGSVRSGKTYVSLILWGFWVATMPSDGAYIMAGKTLTTLKRNVLEPLREIFGEDFSYSLSKKEGALCGRKIYLEGGADARSEAKIRGLTLDGAYCDELTLFEEDFFVMLLSRLSKPSAKLFATTNPDHPRHWVKRNYLDNEKLDLLSVRFTLDDNIFLEKKYVESLKNEYKGMYYDRFIRGMWVAAEGRIYEEFTRDMILTHDGLMKQLEQNPIMLSVAGVDYGGSGSASAFCLVGFDRGFKNVYMLDEFYDAKNKSAECLIDNFKRKIDEWKLSSPVLRTAYCDSAEQLLIKSFRSAVRLEVKNAMKRQVNTRINMLNRLLASKRFYVCDCCPHFIEAVETAVWDTKNLHTDVRLDNGTTNIDSLDAFEYAIERFEKELFRL